MSYGARTFKCIDINGLAGSGTVSFECAIPAGKGRRRIAVEVKPEQLYVVVLWLLRNPNHVGHAMYHLNYPNEGETDALDRPCSSCERDYPTAVGMLAQVLNDLMLNRELVKLAEPDAQKGSTP